MTHWTVVLKTFKRPELQLQVRSLPFTASYQQGSGPRAGGTAGTGTSSELQRWDSTMQELSGRAIYGDSEERGLDKHATAHRAVTRPPAEVQWELLQLQPHANETMRDLTAVADMRVARTPLIM